MRPGFADAYSYLLGLYLGDGYIWESGRLSWRLGVTLDRNYPEVEEAVRAIMRLLPRGGRRRYSYPRYFFTNYSADI